MPFFLAVVEGIIVVAVVERIAICGITVVFIRFLILAVLVALKGVVIDGI